MAAKKKHTLSFELEFDFEVIGISCHQKDFKLCWSINEATGWELKKENDLQIVIKGFKDPQAFSQFVGFDSETGCEYILLENKKNAQLLLPEFKEMDFLFLVKGPYDTELINSVVSRFKKVPLILTSVLLPKDKIINKQNLYEFS